MQIETQAIEWPPHVWQRRAELQPSGRSWRALAAAFLAGAVTAAGLVLVLRGLPLAEPLAGGTAAAGADVRELPREWRWERPRVRYDHMFRAARR